MKNYYLNLTKDNKPKNIEQRKQSGNVSYDGKPSVGDSFFFSVVFLIELFLIKRKRVYRKKFATRKSSVKANS